MDVWPYDINEHLHPPDGGLWKIRPAVPADAPALAAMRWDFRTEVADERLVVEEAAHFLIRCSEWMAVQLSDTGTWRAWCGRVEGELAGTVWAQSTQKVPNPLTERERLGYVTNLYVKPEFRGRGLGRTLTAAAVDWCRQSGAAEVLLWPTPASRPMYSLLEFEPACGLLRLILPNDIGDEPANLSIQLCCSKVAP